jgi:hypothetical protein
MSIEYRYAQGGEYPAFSAFLHNNWAENHIYCRSEELFNWTFRRRGFVEDDRYSIAVCTDEERLVGFLGGIRFNFNVFGESRPGVWLANYVVHEDYRRGPTALKLLGMMRKDPYWATVAFGMDDDTALIYRALRGKVLPYIPRHVAVLPGRSDRLEHLLRTAFPERAAADSSALAKQVELASVPSPAHEAGSGIPEAWDSVDFPILARATVGAARDQGFLEWRYRDHPIFDYRFISVKEGDRAGLAVWRLETVRRLNEVGEREPIADIARLVEFLPVSKENGGELLAHFWDQIQAVGAFGADYYGFHGPTRRMLTELGFPVVSQSDGDAVPSRFQPLDGRGGAIMSAWFMKGDVPDCDESDDCPWHWTKADSDMDRPN